MENLKHIREQNGLIQSELAEQMGVTKQTVYKWERGITPVAPEHWIRYAKILKLTTEQFENALIETLKSYAIETLTPDGLVSAMKSGRYDSQKIFLANQELLKTITEPLKILDTASNVRKSSEEGCFVPIISQAAAATCNPGLMPLLDCVNENSENTTWFKQAKSGDFVIEVSGSSMTPWYPDGTLLLVRPYQTLRNGQRVVAVLDTGEIVFKIYAEKNGKICLFSIDKGGLDYIWDRFKVPLRYICRVIASQRNEDDLDEEMKMSGIVHDWQLKIKEV